MGCLLNKCSLTNVALIQGQPAYLNLVIPVKRSSTDGFIKVGDEYIPVETTPYGRYESTEYFTPIGIMFKGVYEGYSLVTPDWTDENNRFMLRLLVKYINVSYYKTHSNSFSIDADGGVSKLAKDLYVDFDHEHLLKLVNEQTYEDAWEYLIEYIRFIDRPKVHIDYTGFGKSKYAPLFASLIDGNAYDYIMDESHQADVVSCKFLCKTEYKTIDSRVNLIYNELQQDFSAYNVMKIFSDSHHHDGLSPYKHYCEIYKSEIYGYRESLNHELSVDPEYLMMLIKNLVLANYIHTVFVYYNIMYLPSSNITTEEYHNEHSRLHAKMVNHCLRAHSDHHRDWSDGEFWYVTQIFDRDEIFAIYISEIEEIIEKFGNHPEDLDLSKEIVCYNKRTNEWFSINEKELFDKYFVE